MGPASLGKSHIKSFHVKCGLKAPSMMRKRVILVKLSYLHRERVTGRAKEGERWEEEADTSAA